MDLGELGDRGRGRVRRVQVVNRVNLVESPLWVSVLLFVYRLVVFASALTFLLAFWGLWYLMFSGGIVLR